MTTFAASQHIARAGRFAHDRGMADSAPPLPRRRAKAMPLPDQVALVLQGGGALGSYQAGVIEALEDSAITIDWVAGISIGAVNAAILAGNRPEDRVAKLRQFWSIVTAGLPSFPIYPDDRIREFLHEWSAGYVALAGVPGFFAPRAVPPAMAPPGQPGALSIYDSAELAATLDKVVDWDRLNDGAMRLSVGAVDVESGNFRYFDTAIERIDVRHIMASGALPPGLPPVEIDGRWWWDGGLVSNTPLAYVLDHQTEAMLVFQVDLFAAAAERPRTIMDVMAREKEIRYSSRTRSVTTHVLKMRREHELVRSVLTKLPPTLADDAEVTALAALVAEKPLSLVHLIYRANAWEGGSRDYEFSTRTMREHWAAGQAHVDKTMANAELLAHNVLTGRTAAFDLG
jgi:NTE family protein